MKAGDLMTTGAATIMKDASLAEAVQLLLDYRISGLPVVDSGGELVGIVTEHDFLRRNDGTHPRWMDVLLSDNPTGLVLLQTTRVEDVMTKEPLSVTVEAPVTEVLELMLKHRVRRLPVVKAGRVAGIVSRANLIEALIRKLNQSPGNAA